MTHFLIWKIKKNHHHYYNLMRLYLTRTIILCKGLCRQPIRLTISLSNTPLLSTPSYFPDLKRAPLQFLTLVRMKFVNISYQLTVIIFFLYCYFFMFNFYAVVRNINQVSFQRKHWHLCLILCMLSFGKSMSGS